MLFELADTVERKCEWIEANSLKRGCDILCNWTLDFADESQCQVQLLVILPAQVWHALHQIEQLLADGFRRADSDKQPMHDPLLVEAEAPCDRFRLKAANDFPILCPGARAHSPSVRRDNAEPI